jgi:hypothetical protein
MAYVSRNIRDRIAVGDDCFIIEDLPDGRKRLIPSPDSVDETGTDINKALLQPMEDNIIWLMNSVFNDITSNPFNFSFIDNLGGIETNGVWNVEKERIEC